MVVQPIHTKLNTVLVMTVDTHFVGQQQIPDLSQILLGEDEAHVSLNVGQKPDQRQYRLLRYSWTFVENVNV